MKRHYYTILILCLYTTGLIYAQPGNKENWFDEEKHFIDSVLFTMTSEEKIAQTCQLTLDAVTKKNNGEVVDPLQLDSELVEEVISDFAIGSMLNVSSHTLGLDEWRRVHDAVNRPYFEGKTKTPLLYGVDAIHGANYVIGGTLFPQEIGIAATWNPTIASTIGVVTAYETRASGVPWNFSPVLDLGRQPLWSRFFETLGEDVYLASELGKSIVNGYQGNDVSSPYKVAACLKHFVGYSYPNSGRDRTPAWIPERQMKQYFLPPFERAIKEGALTVMVNSGDVNGIPGHINHDLLTKTLKNTWGFEGFAVSDWEDLIMLHTVHKIASTKKEAIQMAINAGVDMSMVPNYKDFKEYCMLFKQALDDGSISMQRLNDAVYRILLVKYRLGLFEKRKETAYPLFSSESFRKSSFDAACESITLLKNNDVLPLQKGKKILLMGPTADNLIYLNGAWTHTWQGLEKKYNSSFALTVKEAFEERFGTKQVMFEQGVKMSTVNSWEECEIYNQRTYKKKAKKADVIFICLGEQPSTEKPGDIKSLNLCPEQIELCKTAAKFNKPIVLILLEGRPRIISEIEPNADAIIQCYLPGDFGAEALVRIIDGEINPSGKLPYTYPKYDGVYETYDRVYSENRSGKSFGFDAFDPQYEFGHGLSYTSFEYSELKAKSDVMQRGGKLFFSVKVTNTGQQKGKEVVQWFVRDHYASITPSVKKLVSFEKIELEPGESKTLSFILTTDRLEFIGRDNEPVVETGNYSIEVKGLTKNFTLYE